MTTKAPEADTRVEGLAPGVWPVAWTVVVGALGVLFGTTIVAVAVEPLAGILDVPLSTIQWISTGYLLALAVVIPVVPWAQRRLGGRRLWILGLLVFLVASVLSALARNATSLIAFRVLQGVGGGILMPMMSTLVMQAAGGKGLARIMAVIGIPASLGPILGPVLGGIVLDRLDWRWLFLVTLPFGVAGIALALKYLPKDEETRPAKLDVTGFALMSSGLAAVLYGLSDASRDGGFLHQDVLVPLLAGLAAIGVFTWRALRRRRTDALIDLRLLRHLPLSSSTLLLFLSGVALYGAMLLVPLYFQQLRGMAEAVRGKVWPLMEERIGKEIMDTIRANASKL